MEVHLTLYCGKINAFRWYALATIKNCYLLPAAPSVYEAVLMQFEPNKVLVSNQLPKGYFAKTNKMYPTGNNLICETKEQLCLRPLMSTSRQ
jgi:hypothetical protein